MPIDDESAIDSFVLPDSKISLKLVFDNVRNYAIVGGLIALAGWFQTGKAVVVPGLFPRLAVGSWQLDTLVTLAIAIVLLMLNVLQTYLMVRRAARVLLKRLGNGPGASFRLPWYVYPIAMILGLAVLIIAFVWPLLLARFAFYITWFAAVGGR